MPTVRALTMFAWRSYDSKRNPIESSGQRISPLKGEFSSTCLAGKREKKKRIHQKEKQRRKEKSLVRVEIESKEDYGKLWNSRGSCKVWRPGRKCVFNVMGDVQMKIIRMTFGCRMGRFWDWTTWIPEMYFGYKAKYTLHVRSVESRVYLLMPITTKRLMNAYCLLCVLDTAGDMNMIPAAVRPSGVRRLTWLVLNKYLWNSEWMPVEQGR